MVVAVPVAPHESVDEISREGTRDVCLEQPRPFFAVGEFYNNFEQVDDSEVRRLLEDAWEKRRFKSAE